MRNQGGGASLKAASCPVCGRQTAVLKPGYDFTNFAIAKALASPDWSETTLDAVRQHLRAVVASARDNWSDPVAEDELNTLNRMDPALAAALRARVAGRSRAEALELLEAVLEAVSAMSTAAANGRLTTQLQNALVHSSLP